MSLDIVEMKLSEQNKRDQNVQTKPRTATGRLAEITCRRWRKKEYEGTFNLIY